MSPNLPITIRLHLKKKSFQTFQTFQSTLTAFFVFGYPITVISGATTGYVDTLIFPTGMILSNLPGGGVMLLATNLSTSASTIPPFAISADYATNAGTATFASNAGSLNGLPGTSYLTASATNGMTTNVVGLTLYVSKQGSDSNAGTAANPFLTISNAISKLSSNIYQTTSYNFSMGASQSLTGQTFTVGTTFATRVTWTWVTNNPPGANQILLFAGGSGGARSKSNTVNLYYALTNGLTYAWPSSAVISLAGNTGSVAITSATGTFYSVATDMTNYCTVSSNQNNSVTNFVPADVQVAGGYYVEPYILVPSDVGIYGAGQSLTVISNTSPNSIGIALSSSNVFRDIGLICPGAEPLSFQAGQGSYVIDCYIRGISDGLVLGGGLNHCWGSSVWSTWDVVYTGPMDIRDSDLHSIGPDPNNAGAIGTCWRSANGTAYNTIFECYGNKTNHAVTVEGGSGPATLTGCTILTPMTNSELLSYSIYNDGSGTITDAGADTYDRTKTLGTVLHNTIPLRDLITITNTWSAVTNRCCGSDDGGTNFWWYAP